MSENEQWCGGWSFDSARCGYCLDEAAAPMDPPETQQSLDAFLAELSADDEETKEAPQVEAEDKKQVKKPVKRPHKKKPRRPRVDRELSEDSFDRLSTSRRRRQQQKRGWWGCCASSRAVHDPTDDDDIDFRNSSSSWSSPHSYKPTSNPNAWPGSKRDPQTEALIRRAIKAEYAVEDLFGATRSSR